MKSAQAHQTTLTELSPFKREQVLIDQSLECLLENFSHFVNLQEQNSVVVSVLNRVQWL